MTKSKDISIKVVAPVRSKGARDEARKKIKRAQQSEREYDEINDRIIEKVKRHELGSKLLNRSRSKVNNLSKLASIGDKYDIEYHIWSDKEADNFKYSYKIVLNLQIETNDNSDSTKFVRDAVDAALGQHFCDTGVTEAEKERLIENLTSALLQPAMAGAKKWVNAIAAQRADQFQSASQSPEFAPAIWRVDKQSGDTPPDFIKRHYGPWLSADATGLTRPDLKRLDPSLYMALANWLRKNELPADCPVPIKSERVNADLGRFLEGGIGAIVTGPSDPEHVLRESRRISSAIHRRTTRQTSK